MTNPLLQPASRVIDKVARDKRIPLRYMPRMILSARTFFFGWYFGYPLPKAEVGTRSQ